MILYNNLKVQFPHLVDICFENNINPCTSDVYNIILNDKGGSYKIMDYHQFYQCIYTSGIIPNSDQWYNIKNKPDYIEIYEALCHIDYKNNLPSVNIIIMHDSVIMLKLYVQRILSSPYLADILTPISELVAIHNCPNCVNWLKNHGLLNHFFYNKVLIKKF